MAVDDLKSAEGATIGQRLDQAIDATREKFGHLSGETKDRIARGKEKVTELRDKGRDSVTDLRDKGLEAVAELRKKNVDDVLVAVKDFAKEHPATTLIGGVALGFLVGFIFRSRD